MENNSKILIRFLETLATDKGYSRYKISKEIGCSESSVKRFFEFEGSPSLDLFLSISSLVGVNFFFEDKESESERPLHILFNQALDSLKEIRDL
ncbi:hypothetical protein [Chryseobacterium terrae]|uniref:HTH cro/C1-type domain-containing protein n=1 Tax=Chryseobacterium terrae TaxID=3163299 RepID=A0ABW8Y535_9FLAO